MATDTLWRFELEPVAEDGGQYHAHPPPPPDVIGYEWVSNLYFEAGLVGIFHGKLAKSGAPGTLMVLSFRFTNSSANRNACFKRAEITLHFAARRKQTTNLSLSPNKFKIIDVSPCGDFAVDPVRWQLQKTWHAEPNFTVGVPVPGSPGLGFTGYLDKVSNLPVIDKAVLTGGAVVLPKDVSLQVRRAARFTMEENPTTLGGVPSRVQVAVLLQRNPEDEGFVMFPEVDLRTGSLQHAKRKVWRFFGLVSESEATVIDVATPGNLIVDGLSPEKLDGYDLDKLSDVITFTELSGIHHGLENK